jgi:RNA polymerase sigma-32 factor
MMLDNAGFDAPGLATEALRSLNDRERIILTARRLKERPDTLEELAQRFNISRERVRQIDERAFQKFSKALRLLRSD